MDRAMAYQLQAFVGVPAALAPLGAVVPVGEGLALAPRLRVRPLLRRWETEHDPDLSDLERAELLARADEEARALLDEGLALSRAGAVAWIEADFFGGSGRRAAAAWLGGAVALEPRIAEGAIDRALEVLGVVSTPLQDGFDRVGLGRFRSTREWIRAAGGR
jgi:hypothetical protein